MPLPAQARQINRSFMREEVYETLLKWILQGVLAPGEKLSDNDLANHLGVSRTPVREALRRLEDKGLVVTAANRWTRVADITPGEAELIYPVIWSLEELALDFAMPRLTPGDLDEMERLNRLLAEAIATGNPMMASDADADFHGVYIERSRNHYLSKILGDMKIQYRRLEIDYFGGRFYAEESVREHGRIVDALRRSDQALAKEMIRLNWRSSLNRLQGSPGSEGRRPQPNT